MKYAVIDSGPLIKGVRLEALNAERYVTVPEVLLELRDRHVREMVAALPFELETREPSSEAIEQSARHAQTVIATPCQLHCAASDRLSRPICIHCRSPPLCQADR